MITDIITDALLTVGFQPNYILFGSFREVNQLIETLPLKAVDVDNPDGVNIIAATDLLFSGNSMLTQYGNAIDTTQFRILFARKNPGSIDVPQLERFNRALGMLTYAKRFALALNNDQRTRVAKGYLDSIQWEAVYNLFDVDMDGVLLTVPITENIPVVPVC